MPRFRVWRRARAYREFPAPNPGLAASGRIPTVCHTPDPGATVKSAHLPITPDDGVSRPDGDSEFGATPVCRAGGRRPRDRVLSLNAQFVPERRLSSAGVDRPNRAAHHHAPPVRPVRLPAPRGAGRGRLDRAHPVRAPEARRRRRRARRGATRGRARAARRADRGAGGHVPADLVDLALWMADEYCSTPARALALVTPPPGKAKTSLWAEATGADGRVNDEPARAARAAARAGRRRPGRAAAAREARAGARSPSGSRGARRGRTPRRTAQVELTRRAAERAGGDRGRARARRACCTASPARARPRSTCAPRPRRSSAARA